MRASRSVVLLVALLVPYVASRVYANNMVGIVGISIDDFIGWELLIAVIVTHS